MSIIIPAILGPTGIGKSTLALQCAETLGQEILSCDSRQVYQSLCIGTARPTPEEEQRVRHWMIGLRSPDAFFSAHDYSSMALDIIRCQHRAGQSLLLCGGTGLYYSRLCRGIGPQVAPDPQLRSALSDRAKTYGAKALWDELNQADPASAKLWHPNNLVKTIRALEVYYKTGIPLSLLGQQAVAPADIVFVPLLLTMSRGRLYERIEKRVDAMVAAGLFEEFLGLCEAGYTRESPGLATVGYRELFAVTSGEKTLEQAVAQIKQNSRNYAKRQITWFTRQLDPGYATLDLDTDADPVARTIDWISRLLNGR